MTQKHFIALADALRESKTLCFKQMRDGGYDLTTIHRTLNILTEELADFCQQQNPQFNRERWLAYIAGACGPNGGPMTGGIHKGRMRTL